MCSLHLSVHTWSSGQPTVQRPGSSRGLPAGVGIRTHNLGLPRVSSRTLYPLGQRLPLLIAPLIVNEYIYSFLQINKKINLALYTHTFILMYNYIFMYIYIYIYIYIYTFILMYNNDILYYLLMYNMNTIMCVCIYSLLFQIIVNLHNNYIV